MKKILLTILLAMPLAASAYDFMVGGVAYKVISLSDLTCEVTKGCQPKSGKLKIPAEVIYEGRIFKVLGIGDGGVADYLSIRELVIENGPTYIGESAFFGQEFDEIVIPPSINTIRSFAFSSNKLSVLTFSYSDEPLSAVSGWAFARTTISTLYLLRPVVEGTIPDILSNSVENFVIGEKVRRIGERDAPLFGMSNLKRLEIGMRLRELPDLHEGEYLEYIAIFSMRPPVAHGFSERTKMKTTLYVPVGAKEIYEKANIWKEFWHIEEHEQLTPCMPNVPDINQDDKIGQKDFTALVDYIMGKKPENVTPVTADVNYDGKVNIADIVSLTDVYRKLLEEAGK